MHHYLLLPHVSPVQLLIYDSTQHEMIRLGINVSDYINIEFKHH